MPLGKANIAVQSARRLDHGPVRCRQCFRERLKLQCLLVGPFFLAAQPRVFQKLPNGVPDDENSCAVPHSQDLRNIVESSSRFVALQGAGFGPYYEDISHNSRYDRTIGCGRKTSIELMTVDEMKVPVRVLK